MNKATKIFATGLLFGACSWASAIPVITVSSEGSIAATAAQGSFQSLLHTGYLTEDFEDFGTLTPVSSVADQSISISSAGIADFKMEVAGNNTGACKDNGYSCTDGLAVLNNDDGVSPFQGRFSIPEDTDNKHWLDSMDAREFSISVATGFNALGFFITDPNDAGGRFDIGGTSFSFLDIFGSSLGNGKEFYISIYDTDATTLEKVSIITGAGNDGFGVDQVTVGRVPEPGTLALLGLALAGLGVARFRKQA